MIKVKFVSILSLKINFWTLSIKTVSLRLNFHNTFLTFEKCLQSYIKAIIHIGDGGSGIPGASVLNKLLRLVAFRNIISYFNCEFWLKKFSTPVVNWVVQYHECVYPFWDVVKL